MAESSVDPSEKSEPTPTTDAPQAEVKKKATRKRTTKKKVASAEAADAATDEQPKKKVSRKRVAKKTTTEAAENASAAPEKAEKVEVPAEPERAEAPADAAAPMPEATQEGKSEDAPAAEGGVRRVSVPREKRDENENRDGSGDDFSSGEEGEGGERRGRRRRRRRRGGGGGESSEIEAGEESAREEEFEPSRREDGKRPSVKVRQPEPRRSQDRKPSGYTEDPEKLAAYAWELFKNEVREEGGTLIEDRDARKIAERAFRMAEIFLIEESRTIGG